MKKLLSFIFLTACFLGTVSAQNPTLIYSSNGITQVGGPVGKVTLSVDASVLRTNSFAVVTQSLNGVFIRTQSGFGTNTTIATLLTVNGNLTTTNGNVNMTFPNGTTTNTWGGLGTNLIMLTSASRDANGNINMLNFYKGTTLKATMGFRDNDLSGFQMSGSSTETIQLGGANIKIMGGPGGTISIWSSAISFGQTSAQMANFTLITNSYLNGGVFIGPTLTVHPITTFVSNVTHSAATTLGSSGTLFTNLVSATASLDFGNILVATFEDLPIAVTGAKANDTVSIGRPATENGGLQTSGFVASNGWVTIRAKNVGSLAIDQAALTYRATVTEH